MSVHMHFVLGRVNQPLGSVLSCCSATARMYTICSGQYQEKFERTVLLASLFRHFRIRKLLDLGR